MNNLPVHSLPIIHIIKNHYKLTFTYIKFKCEIHKIIFLYYRKRFNNGPPFLHACTLFMYEIHA